MIETSDLLAVVFLSSAAAVTLGVIATILVCGNCSHSKPDDKEQRPPERDGTCPAVPTGSATSDAACDQQHRRGSPDSLAPSHAEMPPLASWQTDVEPDLPGGFPKPFELSPFATPSAVCDTTYSRSVECSDGCHCIWAMQPPRSSLGPLPTIRTDWEVYVRPQPRQPAETESQKATQPQLTSLPALKFCEPKANPPPPRPKPCQPKQPGPPGPPGPDPQPSPQPCPAPSPQPDTPGPEPLPTPTEITEPTEPQSHGPRNSQKLPSPNLCNPLPRVFVQPIPELPLLLPKLLLPQTVTQVCVSSNMDWDLWQSPRLPPDPPLIPGPCIQPWQNMLEQKAPDLKRKKPRETQRGPVLQAPACITSQPAVQPDRRDRQADCKVQEPLNGRGEEGVAADAEPLARCPLLVFRILKHSHGGVARPRPKTGKFNACAPRIGRMKIEPRAPAFSIQRQEPLGVPRQPHDTMAVSVLVTPVEWLITRPTSTDPPTPLDDRIPQSLDRRHLGQAPTRQNYQRLTLQSLHDHPDPSRVKTSRYPPCPGPWTIPVRRQDRQEPLKELRLQPLVLPFAGNVQNPKVLAQTEEAPRLPKPAENPVVNYLLQRLRFCLCKEEATDTRVRQLSQRQSPADPQRSQKPLQAVVHILAQDWAWSVDRRFRAGFWCSLSASMNSATPFEDFEASQTFRGICLTSTHPITIYYLSQWFTPTFLVWSEQSLTNDRQKSNKKKFEWIYYKCISIRCRVLVLEVHSKIALFSFLGRQAIGGQRVQIQLNSRFFLWIKCGKFLVIWAF